MCYCVDLNSFLVLNARDSCLVTVTYLKLFTVCLVSELINLFVLFCLFVFPFLNILQSCSFALLLSGLSALFRTALTIMDLLESRLMDLNDEGAVLPLLLRVPVDV